MQRLTAAYILVDLISLWAEIVTILDSRLFSQVWEGFDDKAA
jgi:hypothetical protein